jgi:hypothetical protein
MFGLLAKAAKVVASPVGRAVASEVGKKVFKRSNVARVVKEGTEALAAIEFLKNKYGNVDDDAAWAWRELAEFKDALRDFV